MIENAEQLLREHEIQVTAQRLAVLNAVSARPHATADDIVNDVRASIGAVSRQAVFDSLGVLAEKGLIRRIQPARSAARYEDRGRRQPSPSGVSRLWPHGRCRLRGGLPAVPGSRRRLRLRH